MRREGYTFFSWGTFRAFYCFLLAGYLPTDWCLTSSCLIKAGKKKINRDQLAGGLMEFYVYMWKSPNVCIRFTARFSFHILNIKIFTIYYVYGMIIHSKLALLYLNLSYQNQVHGGVFLRLKESRTEYLIQCLRRKLSS